MEDQSSGNIRVLCRFRPMNFKQQTKTQELCVDFIDQKSVRTREMISHCFTLDHIFSPTTSQQEVYTIAAKPVVNQVMQGFNGTIIAYGQTSSGKTFTMTGADIDSQELRGIIPRMIETVFETIERASEKVEYSVKVSYAEIYLQKIRDLINPALNDLKIHQERAKGIYIKDLSEYYVASEEEVYEYMKIGTNNRQVGYTDMNSGSSRSHSIFVVTISQKNLIDMTAKTGKFYLVDLAGSEKVGKTGAQGIRLTEAANINRSLSALGNVINSLTDGKSSHIPYRDSKLTRVLKDSLGGNSKTSLIITCSPSKFNQAQTISTLRFGERAKSIKNKAKVNKEFTVAQLKLMLAKAREEIFSLNKKVQELQGSVQSPGKAINSAIFTEVSEEVKQSEFQVIEELEIIRKRLSECLQENQVLKEQLLTANESLAFAFNENMEKDVRLADCQYKLQICQNQTKEQQDTIERLADAKQSLEVDLVSLSEIKIKLEQKLNEKSIELKEFLIKSDPTSLAIQMEITEQNSSHTKTILDQKVIQVENLRRSFKSELEFQIRDQMKKQYEDLLSQMETKIKSYVKSCQQQMQATTEFYMRRERLMNQDEISLRKRNDTIEKHLEQLTDMYQQLIRQKSQLKAEKQYYQKKVFRLQESTNKLKNKVTGLRSELLDSRAKNAQFSARIEEMTRMVGVSSSVFRSNLIKTIRGGGNSNRLQVLNFRSSAFFTNTSSQEKQILLT